jgi:hypothetical protein
MTSARCPACHADLDCAADAPACWCQGVDLAPEVLAALARQYDGCLCLNCLRTLSETPPASKPLAAP